MDQMLYYLKRKNEIDILIEKEDSSTTLKKKALEILSGDMNSATSEIYRQKFPELIQENSTFEQRFQDFMKENSNGRTEG